MKTKVVEYVKGFKNEGDWDQNSEYQSGDVVNYNGSSYVALTTSLAGFQPPQYLGIATDPSAKMDVSYLMVLLVRQQHTLRVLTIEATSSSMVVTSIVTN